MEKKVFLCLMLAVLFVSVPSADPIHLQQIPCGDGSSLWLWTQGEDMTCEEVEPGVTACWDANDYARGSCQTACEEIRIGNMAGCYRGGGSPPILQPLFTVECPGPQGGAGAVYDLTGQTGDTCEVTTGAENATTGGECYHEVNGVKVTTSKVVCGKGCIISMPPADCKKR